MGGGVLGVGVLTLEFGLSIDPASIPLVPGLAILGAVIGLLPVIRDRPDLDPWVVPRAMGFIAALVVLAVVVAILATVLRERAVAAPPTAVLIGLGLFSAAGSLGIGINARRSLPALAATDEAAARVLMSRAIIGIVPFQVATMVASAVGIVLISTS
jgi:hypothetical protein